jgi:hypothetical protein
MALALEGGRIGFRYERSTCGDTTVVPWKGGGGGWMRWLASRAFYGRFGEEKILILMLKIEPQIFGRGLVASQFSR